MMWGARGGGVEDYNKSTGRLSYLVARKPTFGSAFDFYFLRICDVIYNILYCMVLGFCRKKISLSPTSSLGGLGCWYIFACVYRLLPAGTNIFSIRKYRLPESPLISVVNYYRKSVSKLEILTVLQCNQVLQEIKNNFYNTKKPMTQF